MQFDEKGRTFAYASGLQEMQLPGLIIIAIDDFAIHAIGKFSQGIVGNGGA